MAKTGKSSKKQSASKMAVPAGPSGKMHTFSGAGPQASDRTAVTKHAGKGAEFPSGGPSGKMAKFVGVKTQKPGVTHNTNSGGGGGSYAKK
jgi:hypothetical protein